MKLALAIVLLLTTPFALGSWSTNLGGPASPSSCPGCPVRPGHPRALAITDPDTLFSSVLSLSPGDKVWVMTMNGGTVTRLVPEDLSEKFSLPLQELVQDGVSIVAGGDSFVLFQGGGSALQANDVDSYTLPLPPQCRVALGTGLVIAFGLGWDGGEIAVAATGSLGNVYGTVFVNMSVPATPTVIAAVPQVAVQEWTLNLKEAVVTMVAGTAWIVGTRASTKALALMGYSVPDGAELFESSGGCPGASGMTALTPASSDGASHLFFAGSGASALGSVFAVTLTKGQKPVCSLIGTVGRRNVTSPIAVLAQPGGSLGLIFAADATLYRYNWAPGSPSMTLAWSAGLTDAEQSYYRPVSSFSPPAPGFTAVAWSGKSDLVVASNYGPLLMLALNATTGSRAWQLNDAVVPTEYAAAAPPRLALSERGDIFFATPLNQIAAVTLDSKTPPPAFGPNDLSLVDATGSKECNSLVFALVLPQFLDYTTLRVNFSFTASGPAASLVADFGFNPDAKGYQTVDGFTGTLGTLRWAGGVGEICFNTLYSEAEVTVALSNAAGSTAPVTKRFKAQPIVIPSRVPWPPAGGGSGGNIFGLPRRSFYFIGGGAVGVIILVIVSLLLRTARATRLARRRFVAGANAGLLGGNVNTHPHHPPPPNFR